LHGRFAKWPAARRLVPGQDFPDNTPLQPVAPEHPIRTGRNPDTFALEH
jgi:Ni,Fe-hydrogenase III component G